MVGQHFKQSSYSGRIERKVFCMREASFYMLCEELRPYLTKQTTTKTCVCRNSSCRHTVLFSGFIWFRKVNCFKIHSPCYLCDFRKNLGQSTYYFLERKKKSKIMPQTFTIDIVSLNASVLLTVHI